MKYDNFLLGNNDSEKSSPKYEDLDEFLSFIDEDIDDEDELDEFLSFIDEED